MITKMENKFTRVHSTKDIIISVTLLVAGCALALLPLGISLNLTGYLIIPCALAMLFILKSEYKNTADNERYKKKVYNFPINVEAELTKALACNPQGIDTECIDKGNALQLEIYYSTRNGKAFMQLSKYVPYKYEPQTDFIECSIDKAARLIK